MPLDYTPERGKVPGVDVVCGTILSTHGSRTNTVADAIRRRLEIGGGTMACHRHELLLPPSSPDIFRDLDLLIQHFERTKLPAQRDLMVIFTIRFDAGRPLHADWETARQFAYQHLATKRGLAVVLVQHDPSLAGFSSSRPHVHALVFARQLQGSNFGGFTPLRLAGAKATLAAEWSEWLASQK